MQQEKMGCLLRKLRKEKGMTQEQMAEVFSVSNRTVSRWENGINMPDISILIEISNYFDISILELIEGERKEEIMITGNNDELKKIADYANEREGIILKNVHRTDVVGFVCCMMSGVALDIYSTYGGNVWLLLQVILIGVAAGMLFGNIMYAVGIMDMLSRKKEKYRLLRWLEVLLLIILLIDVLYKSYLFIVR